MPTALRLTTGARFNNATLDAIIENLQGYYRFDEEVAGSFVFRNWAPYGKLGPMTQSGGVTVSSGGPDGYGVTLTDNADYCIGTCIALPPGQAEWTWCMWVAPDDATPVALGSFGGITRIDSGTEGTSMGHTATDGFPYLYANAGFRITGVSNPFSDNTMAFAAQRVYYNSGVATYEIFVNGTSIGTNTLGIITPTAFYSLDFGRFGPVTDAVLGEGSALMLWDRALNTTELSALYNSGTGRFLQGAGL